MPGDETGPGGGGMDTVLRPISGLLLQRSGGKQTVQGEERIRIFPRQPAGHHDFGVQILPQVVFVRRVVQDERFQNQDFRRGMFLDILQKAAVIRFVFLRSPPSIVDADEDGEDIRLPIDAVGLPASEQFLGPVAADALI